MVLKLFHRCDYWGGHDIQGRDIMRMPESTWIQQSHPHLQNSLLFRRKRVIVGQAVLSQHYLNRNNNKNKNNNVEKSWGCCPHEGQRVVEINEKHFLHHWKGQWELHFIRAAPDQSNGKKSSGCVYTYVLQPSVQAPWMHNHNNSYYSTATAPTQTFMSGAASAVDGSAEPRVATLNASIMRMELAHYFRRILAKASQNHVHVLIVMDHLPNICFYRRASHLGKKKHKRGSEVSHDDTPTDQEDDDEVATTSVTKLNA